MGEMGEEATACLQAGTKCRPRTHRFAVAAPFERSEFTERWVSGLNQQFTKLSSPKKDRGFESLSLRQSFIYFGKASTRF